MCVIVKLFNYSICYAFSEFTLNTDHYTKDVFLMV